MDSIGHLCKIYTLIQAVITFTGGKSKWICGSLMTLQLIISMLFCWNLHTPQPSLMQNKI